MDDTDCDSARTESLSRIEAETASPIMVFFGPTGWFNEATGRICGLHCRRSGRCDLVVSRQTAAMVDVGPDPAANRVLSHLRNQGIRRLEWVLITHQHPDHYRGLETLVQYIEVGSVLHGPLLETSGDWLRLQERLSAFGIPMREVSSGEDLLGTIHLQRFAPVSSRHLSENDRSVALRIDGQMGSVLLTGDLEAFGEKRLSSMNPGQVDILKLGHHGSQTSTTNTLLKETLPSLSIASCGDRNRYGFPHRTILQRLQRAKIPVLSTAQHGLIRIILGMFSRFKQCVRVTTAPYQVMVSWISSLTWVDQQRRRSQP